MIINAIFVAIGLTAGNSLYELFKKNSDWGKVADRSYFQAVAIGIFVYTQL